MELAVVRWIVHHVPRHQVFRQDQAGIVVDLELVDVDGDVAAAVENGQAGGRYVNELIVGLAFPQNAASSVV